MSEKISVEMTNDIQKYSEDRNLIVMRMSSVAIDLLGNVIAIDDAHSIKKYENIGEVNGTTQ